MRAGYAPPHVKAEATAHAAALAGIYGQPEHAFLLQDPSRVSLEQYAHLATHLQDLPGAHSAGFIGPDRKPRGRAAAPKRTGACARCRRLKVCPPAARVV